MENRIKITKEEMDMYINTGQVVMTGGKRYARIPGWIEIIDEENGIVEMVERSRIPKQLKEIMIEYTLAASSVPENMLDFEKILFYESYIRFIKRHNHNLTKENHSLVHKLEATEYLEGNDLMDKYVDLKARVRFLDIALGSCKIKKEKLKKELVLLNS